ncbi:hypothetical protein GCM10010277_66960 [Streptomyces longisporoflavus]|nr:hypothetical protein GCM10010277_66960 [Streptomyces longisporoflavus]
MKALGPADVDAALSHVLLPFQVSHTCLDQCLMPLRVLRRPLIRTASTGGPCSVDRTSSCRGARDPPFDDS